MKNLLYILVFFITTAGFSQQVLTLQSCYDLAEENYPLARQTDLWEAKSEKEIQIIKKEKLPKLDLNAQATYQSDVIQFPLELPNISIDPPNKDQYRASLDVSQLIYNGGRIGANTKLKEAELQTQQQQVAVNLYALRSRINQSFFNVLLFQEQTELLVTKMQELEVRLKEIKSGVKYGAVLPATEQAFQAEILKLEQQVSEANHDRIKALGNLASLIAKELEPNTTLERPEVSIISKENSKRPEITLFDYQENQLETTKAVISKSNYPRLSGFAQVGYGNPGLNMLDNSFQDFYMVGLKMNWNIFDWGKTKEQKQTIEISKDILATEKQTFELNNAMQLQEAKSEIDKLEELLQRDDAIIALREQVLEAVISQFQNGAISSSEYITELNNLYEAKIGKEVHQTRLSLAKAHYKLIKGN